MKHYLTNDIFFKTLSNYQLELGVFVDESARKKEFVKIGLNNAELMYIHENGSPIVNIPARPVLQMTINYVRNNLLQEITNKCIKAYISSGFKEESIEKELNKACLLIESYARRIIYSNDGRLVPNKPSVAKAKGGNHPLFDTGQLARSITCRVVKTT